jgi:hypothetical protein
MSPETHLVMFNGMASAVPRRISPPRTAGYSPLLLFLIDIDCKELQQRGEGEYSVCFCVVEPILTSWCFEVGRMQFPRLDPLSQGCGTSLLLPAIHIEMVSSCSGKGM